MGSSSVRTAGWLLFATAALLELTACRDEVPVPPPPPPIQPVKRPPVVAPRPIATGASFDLSATSDGAALVWGRPSGFGGGLAMISLDAQGSAQGPERPLLVTDDRPAGEHATELPPDAVEIVAAAGAGRLGVAWVSREHGRLQVRAVLGDDRGETFGPPVRFGAVKAWTRFPSASQSSTVSTAGGRVQSPAVVPRAPNTQA